MYANRKRASWPTKLLYCLHCAAPLNGYGQYCSETCRDQDDEMQGVFQGVRTEPILAEVLQPGLLQDSEQKGVRRFKKSAAAEEARADREASLVIMLGRGKRDQGPTIHGSPPYAQEMA